jgi:hypothetical protein
VSARHTLCFVLSCLDWFVYSFLVLCLSCLWLSCVCLVIVLCLSCVCLVVAVLCLSGNCLVFVVFVLCLSCLVIPSKISASHCFHSFRVRVDLTLVVVYSRDS